MTRKIRISVTNLSETSDVITCILHFPFSQGEKFEFTLIYFLVDFNHSTTCDLYLNTSVME